MVSPVSNDNIQEIKNWETVRPIYEGKVHQISDQSNQVSFNHTRTSIDPRFKRIQFNPLTAD